MELFDTYSVQFGQALAVSDQKTLAIRNRYVEVPGKTDQRCIAAIDGWNAKSDDKL